MKSDLRSCTPETVSLDSPVRGPAVPGRRTENQGNSGSAAGSVQLHRFELKPNCSLNSRTATLFFVSILAVSMTIAGGFAAMGYWPVLPVAGLELSALGAALWLSMKRGRDRDLIDVGPDEVVVSHLRGRERRDQRFLRAWTRVRYAAGRTAGAPGRLEIGAHGHWCAVGEFLTDAERKGLGARLSRVLAEASATGDGGARR